MKPGAPGSPLFWANLGRAVVEIESEWMARGRELEMFDGPYFVVRENSVARSATGRSPCPEPHNVGGSSTPVPLRGTK